MEIGLFKVNFETGERSWSPELRNILGLRSDTPPDFSLFLRCVHPEDRRAVSGISTRFFRPDCPARTTNEFRLLRCDGSALRVRMESVATFRDRAPYDVIRVAGFLVEIPSPIGTSSLRVSRVA